MNIEMRDRRWENQFPMWWQFQLHRIEQRGVSQQSEEVAGMRRLRPLANAMVLKSA